MRHAKELAIYHAAAKQFKKDHPFCGVCIENRTQDVHHIKGRGMYLLDQDTWLPVCRHCHNQIHRFPGESRRLGLIQ
jgi:hypothetical protein